MTYCMYWKYRKTFLHTDWLMSKAFFDSGQIFLIFISSETMERWSDYCACTTVFLRSCEPFSFAVHVQVPKPRFHFSLSITDKRLCAFSCKIKGTCTWCTLLVFSVIWKIVDIQKQLTTNHLTTITTALLCRNIHIQESRKVIKVYKIIHVHVCTFYFTLRHSSTDTNDVFWNNS